MEIKKKLGEDLKAAMKGKDALTLSTVRMILSAIHNKEIEKHSDLTEAEVQKILTGEKKKRLDSIGQFEQGGRADLAAKEKQELGIIESYLPKELSDEELRVIVAAAIAETGASSPTDFGKVMKVVMAASAGRADGSRAGNVVKEKLKNKK